MTSPQLRVDSSPAASLQRTPSYWDPETECTIAYAQPAAEPELWRGFVEGATRSYSRHGVAKALDMDALHSGADTVMFVACVNDAGRVVGGLRMKGPYRSAEESHALLEWEGQRGYDAVRKMITDRLPFGVAEIKTAWVSDDPDRSRQLTTTISRTALHAMGLLDVQFMFATAASYVLKKWLSSGGVLATKIPPTPYPDERYDTRLAWWDRSTFSKHAEPKQLSTYFAEQQRMMPRADLAAGLRPASGMVR